MQEPTIKFSILVLVSGYITLSYPINTLRLLPAFSFAVTLKIRGIKIIMFMPEIIEDVTSVAHNETKCFEDVFKQNELEW